MESNLPDFRHKTVCLYLNHAGPALDSGIVLLSPRFETHDSRLFLLGDCPANWGWSSGRPAAVAWDAVVHYIVFNSESEFEQAMKQGGFWSKFS